MAEIKFNGIPLSNRSSLLDSFRAMQVIKLEGDIDEEALWDSLPDSVKTRFSRLDRGEPVSEKWDYLSWIDAISNCAQSFDELEINEEGSGILYFEQLSWPSGGVEATEEILRVHGGKIESNDAI